MNDYQMMNLANDIVAQRRAEADRSRLVRSAHAETATKPRRSRSHQRQGGPRFSLNTLFHRVAHF
jgi:hypothetical protein